MPSASGLSRNHRIQARDRACQAASLLLHHAPQVHYTQNTRRWDGITHHCNARKGQFPMYADCSAAVTWFLWNGLKLGFGLEDHINGDNWHGGYTGTLRAHGKLVEHRENCQRCDVVIYGNGGTGEHTAMIVGRTKGGVLMVVSHGSEAGPFHLPYDYRKDIMCIRRFI